jgi:pyroglutamyl-peptidase
MKSNLPRHLFLEYSFYTNSHGGHWESYQGVGDRFRRPCLHFSPSQPSAHHRQPFLDITANPSWEIARQMPKSLTGIDGEIIKIIIPAEPTPAAYHKIFTQTPQLIDEHAPDVIVHMGLDVNTGPGVFKLERSAPREGYHDIPDIDRKVFTRAENKKTFGKAPASLITTLKIEAAAEAWQHACSAVMLSSPTGDSKVKGKGKTANVQPVHTQVSDDVGTYVCGFQYYVCMLETQKRTGERNVVFFHVPKLEGKEQVDVGVRVAEELIKVLVNTNQE